MGPLVFWPCLSSTAQSAGLRVSALTAEISMATETATANWRKSWPLMPGMKATGTNTDNKTNVMARIGPVISAMAFLQAIDTGTATIGISVVRHLPSNKNTTTATRMIAVPRVRMTSLIVAVTKTVASQNTV